MSNLVLEFQNGELLENAGSKAPADVSSILANNGYQRFYFKTSEGNPFKQFLTLFVSSVKLIYSAKSGSILLCQYPIYSKKGHIVFRFIRRLLKAKRVRLVALVHDLLFAARSGAGQEEEVKELNKYDSIIVHSAQMASLLNDSGCVRPCIVLGLFDYLVGRANKLARQLSYTITFAGNLSKSSFINSLDDVICNSHVRFVLYGRNDRNLEFGDGIVYNGVFSPDDVSSLVGSWGLVWDGPSIKELSGESGLYQRINSPHKASLYLVAGLPLIVSSEAAIAKIVLDEKIGITIDSLLDIERVISNMTEDKYTELLDNVKRVATQLFSGDSILSALEQVA